MPPPCKAEFQGLLIASRDIPLNSFYLLNSLELFVRLIMESKAIIWASCWFIYLYTTCMIIYLLIIWSKLGLGLSSSEFGFLLGSFSYITWKYFLFWSVFAWWYGSLPFNTFSRPWLTQIAIELRSIFHHFLCITFRHRSSFMKNKGSVWMPTRAIKWWMI